MDNIFQYLMNQGLSHQDLIILLAAPVLILIITFSRQIIGLRGFGIFVPLLMIFGLLKLGFASGTYIIILTTIITSLIRYLLKDIRILYFPRIAFILSLAISSLFLVFLSAPLFFSFNFKSSILAMLSIVVFAEKLAAVQIEQDLKTSVILTAETLLISLAGFFLISWQFFQEFIMTNYPAVIIISLLLTLLLGRWSGLRILEYIRFFQIINK